MLSVNSKKLLKRGNIMSKDKLKALETLEKVKEIYDNEGGDLLCSALWSDFMTMVDLQIAEIIETTK